MVPENSYRLEEQISHYCTGNQKIPWIRCDEITAFPWYEGSYGAVSRIILKPKLLLNMQTPRACMHATALAVMLEHVQKRSNNVFFAYLQWQTVFYEWDSCNHYTLCSVTKAAAQTLSDRGTSGAKPRGLTRYIVYTVRKAPQAAIYICIVQSGSGLFQILNISGCSRLVKVTCTRQESSSAWNSQSTTLVRKQKSPLKRWWKVQMQSYGKKKKKNATHESRAAP